MKVHDWTKEPTDDHEGMTGASHSTTPSNSVTPESILHRLQGDAESHGDRLATPAMSSPSSDRDAVEGCFPKDHYVTEDGVRPMTPLQISQSAKQMDNMAMTSVSPGKAGIICRQLAGARIASLYSGPAAEKSWGVYASKIWHDPRHREAILKAAKIGIVPANIEALYDQWKDEPDVSRTICKLLPPIMLHGSFGIGKSAICASWAGKIGMKTFDIRAADYSSVEISGVMMPDPDYPREIIRAAPKALPNFSRDSYLASILLDELPNASQENQNVLFRLFQDREMGEHFALPPITPILAAGNIREEGATVRIAPLLSGLASRMAHIHIVPDPDEWTKFAIQQGSSQNREERNAIQRFMDFRAECAKFALTDMSVCPEVIAFVNAQPNFFTGVNHGNGNRGFPNPRVWDRVSVFQKLYKNGCLNKDERNIMLEGSVGAKVANVFSQFEAMASELPSVLSMMQYEGCSALKINPPQDAIPFKMDTYLESSAKEDHLNSHARLHLLTSAMIYQLASCKLPGPKDPKNEESVIRFAGFMRILEKLRGADSENKKTAETNRFANIISASVMQVSSMHGDDHASRNKLFTSILTCPHLREVSKSLLSDWVNGGKLTAQDQAVAKMAREVMERV